MAFPLATTAVVPPTVHPTSRIVQLLLAMMGTPDERTRLFPVMVTLSLPFHTIGKVSPAVFRALFESAFIAESAWPIAF